MNLGIRDRVALVCAASKGIGRGCAEALAAEGVRLAICARGAEALNEAARDIAAAHGGTVLAVPCDLADPAAAAELADKVAADLGPVSILVTNAGGPPPGRFLDFDREAWQKAFELNLLSVQALCRAVLPGMQAQRFGRIVNITSVAVKQPIDNLVLSNAVRAAVIGLAKTLAGEVAADGITVNNVCPGYIWTDRSRALVEGRAKSAGIAVEQAKAQLAASIPAGHVGVPADVGALVAFLASEPAGYLTGATIQVDGGLFRGLM